jgi:RHH-type rel operon transcriptional repressor/antitoxin RelB
MKTTAIKKSKPGKPANYSLVLPPEMLERLENLAKATNRSKAFYIKEALQAHLDDLEDGYLALPKAE